MLYRKIVFTAVLAALLFIPLLVRSVGADEAKTTDQKVAKGASVQPVRQIVTSTTFSPVIADFLQRPLASNLVTVNPSGSPQVTVMWFKYENGALLFTTTTDRVKFRNMQKDPRAVFTVTDPTNMYKWVTVQGKLSVVENRDPQAFYSGLAEHYLDAKGLAEWRKSALMDRRTVLRLSPTQIRTMGFPQE